MKLTTYNQNGDSSGETQLPDSLFDQPLNSDLLHRVVVAAQANQRQPIAHGKDRAHQSGGGRKPWRQKGTGRARHGSTRSPIWRAGGVTFGPTNEKKLKKKVNKRERRQAVASALSAKQADGEVFLVSGLEFEDPSSAEAKEFLDNLSESTDNNEITDRRNNANLLVVPEVDQATELSFRNFGNLELKSAKNVNALDILTYKFTIMVEPDEVFSILDERLSGNPVTN